MKREAVFHINTEEFVYPVSRNQLVVKIRTAKKEIKKCSVIYWDRTDKTKKKEAVLSCSERDELFDYFQGRLLFSKIARYHKYYFCLENIEGKQWYYTVNGISRMIPDDGYFEYLYANEKDVISYPKWAKGIVYYQIFPERFCNGDKENNPKGCQEWGTMPTRENYMGGDLKGITEKITYLSQLGVECLYLNPIFEGDFNHKYATTDYFEIDPIFGTKEDFRKLVERCHYYGIKIILDGVFNHTGVCFKQFQDILEKQEKSEYKNWFFIEHYPVKITHYDYECVGAYKWMPKLNSSNKEVRQFILQVMEYWIKEFQIDGWRLDVSDEVDSTVWQEARLYLKERYPQILLIGETWGYGGRLLRGNQLDTVMNYMFRDAVKEYFGTEQISAEVFDYRLNHMLGLYRQETNQIMYNLIDSHDTERFLFYCKEDKKKMKLAVAFQILFIGSPAIYYGDEVGMTGDNDPDCRRCMLWGENADNAMYNWYRKFIQIRKKYDAVRTGNYRTIIVDNDRNIFGFLRREGTEHIYVIIHKGKDEQEVQCPVLEEAEYEEILEGQSFTCEKVQNRQRFYNGDITEYRAVISLKMKPYSVKVISKKKEEKENERM